MKLCFTLIYQRDGDAQLDVIEWGQTIASSESFIFLFIFFGHLKSQDQSTLLFPRWRAAVRGRCPTSKLRRVIRKSSFARLIIFFNALLNYCFLLPFVVLICLNFTSASLLPRIALSSLPSCCDNCGENVLVGAGRVTQNKTPTWSQVFFDKRLIVIV